VFKKGLTVKPDVLLWATLQTSTNNIGNLIDGLLEAINKCCDQYKKNSKIKLTLRETIGGSMGTLNMHPYRNQFFFKKRNKLTIVIIIMLSLFCCGQDVRKRLLYPQCYYCCKPLACKFSSYLTIL